MKKLFCALGILALILVFSHVLVAKDKTVNLTDEVKFRVDESFPSDFDNFDMQLAAVFEKPDTLAAALIVGLSKDDPDFRIYLVLCRLKNIEGVHVVGAGTIRMHGETTYSESHFVDMQFLNTGIPSGVLVPTDKPIGPDDLEKAPVKVGMAA
jgi:hypothetical protein